jgi:hypothetical protein
VFLFLILDPSVALGVVLILGCLTRWFVAPTDRRRTEYLLVTAIFTVLASSVAQAIANNLSRLRPLKYDLFIYRFDAFFGEPSFALGRIVQRHHWLELILNIAYGIMPTVATVVIGTYIYLREGELKIAIQALVIGLLAAPVFYLLLPVCGPQYAFPQFPYAAGIVVARLIPLAAAPNGVPSVHTSTALLLLLLCCRWRTGVVLGSLYLGLIVMSTLASGQHYLFDLFAAVPYAFAVAHFSGLLGLYQNATVVKKLVREEIAPTR